MISDEKERLRATEVWVAMHDDCPWPGCGGCSQHKIEATDEDWQTIRNACRLLGVDEDVFLLHSVQEGLKMMFGKAA